MNHVFLLSDKSKKQTSIILVDNHLRRSTSSSAASASAAIFRAAAMNVFNSSLLIVIGFLSIQIPLVAAQGCVKQCTNNGVFDPASCACICYPGYRGNLCEIADASCPGISGDPFECAAFTLGDCFSNPYLKYFCPFVCRQCCQKKCQHGVLIQPSCICSCDLGYTGDLCEQVDCNQKDPSFCGAYSASSCASVPGLSAVCTILCGPCKKCPAGIVCQNNGILDPATCGCSCRVGFTGSRCETSTCTSVGTDPIECRDVTAADCKLDPLWSEFCPITCGKCPALPCSKICQNLGVLHIPSCSCQCLNNYNGSLCEIFDTKCPSPDGKQCGLTFDVRMCTFNDVKKLCPHMCSQCK